MSKILNAMARAFGSTRVDVTN